MKKRKGIKNIIAILMLLVTTTNVYAITSNDVTYDNNGTTENLTESLDILYNELKKYKTGGSVQPSQMLEGVSGYSKGVLVTGTIPSKGATTYTPGTTNQIIASGQYLSENQIILGDENLISENIKSGVRIFGVEGGIQDQSGKTVEANSITSGAITTYFTIPDGIYNTESRIEVKNSELNNFLGGGISSAELIGSSAGTYTFTDDYTLVVISAFGVRQYSKGVSTVTPVSGYENYYESLYSIASPAATLTHILKNVKKGLQVNIVLAPGDGTSSTLNRTEIIGIK